MGVFTVRSLLSGGVIALVLGVSAPGNADLIKLIKGEPIEGIVVGTTGARIKVQVWHRGFFTIDAKEVQSIEYSDRPGHRSLRTRWAEEAQASSRRQQQQETFEAAQQRKGLVSYRGVWITDDELAQIQLRHVMVTYCY